MTAQNGTFRAVPHVKMSSRYRAGDARAVDDPRVGVDKV
jgi:hypothetical protein